MKMVVWCWIVVWCCSYGIFVVAKMVYILCMTMNYRIRIKRYIGWKDVWHLDESKTCLYSFVGGLREGGGDGDGVLGVTPRSRKQTRL
jgi:hypothetical protein